MHMKDEARVSVPTKGMQIWLKTISANALWRRCGRRHMSAKVGTSKGGGKQWQTTPKNLPGMQCARAIPVT